MEQENSRKKQENRRSVRNGEIWRVAVQLLWCEPGLPHLPPSGRSLGRYPSSKLKRNPIPKHEDENMIKVKSEHPR